MAFFNNRVYGLLSEEATADLLDVKDNYKFEDDAVADAVEELTDDLTNNVEEVPEEDMATNNAELLLTPEMCTIRESSVYTGRMMIEMSDLIRLCEEEEAEQVAAGTDPEDANADAGDMAEKVIEDNGVDPDTDSDGNIQADVVVVVNQDEAAFIAEMALLEAKCGRKNGKAKKKLDQLTNAIEDVKNKGLKVVKTKKRGKR